MGKGVWRLGGGVVLCEEVVSFVWAVYILRLEIHGFFVCVFGLFDSSLHSQPTVSRPLFPSNLGMICPAQLLNLHLNSVLPWLAPNKLNHHNLASIPKIHTLQTPTIHVNFHPFPQ